MTFNELKCVLTDFDPHQAVLAAGIERGKLIVPAGGDIRDIFLVKAKDDLRADLQEALGLNPQDLDDNVALDAIVDAQQLLMRRALAAKQINLGLLRLSTNPESKRYSDAIIAGRDYEKFKQGFPGLRLPDGVATVKSIDLM